MFRQSFIVVLVCVGLATSAFARVLNLETQARIESLARGSSEWTTLQSYCDTHLNSMISPDYAGWEWAIAAMNYGLAYQVALKQGDAVKADQYGKKALALAKVLARDHNLGSDALQQKVGLADGSTRIFNLPFSPQSGSSSAIYLVPIHQVSVIKSTDATDDFGNFGIITKISNTSGGSADYAPSDYRLYFRYTWQVHRLKWLGAKKPKDGSAYYVSLANGTPILVTAENYSISGATLTFKNAPASGNAVFYQAISDNYEQTGNQLGGSNAVQPDGPGYQMRTFNVGLAYVFDMIYDFPDFTTALKKEFYQVLNEQIDWYGTSGYEHDGGGGIGNYFIRGYLTGTMYTAYGTDPINPRAGEFKVLARQLIQITYDAVEKKFSSGYAVQGQYWNGATADMMSVFTKLKNMTGEDLYAKLDWTNHLVPATIHSIKPDRIHGYDGGDWSTLPAGILSQVLQSFITNLPDHAQTPYARQALIDAGIPTTGITADYKVSYPLAYPCDLVGPVYARSDWTTSAVWMSLFSSKHAADHAHRDQGHITIQRGADDLVVDSGEYGDSSTNPFHNTLLFDDANVTKQITYPPGQGWWGWTKNDIRRFSNVDATRMYAQVDFAGAYESAYGGNPVTRARRSVLFIRPGMIIVHDQAQVVNAGIVKMFQVNFPVRPTQNSNVFSFTKGSSRLSMTSLIPSSPSPVITLIDKSEHDSYNYVVSLPTGNLNDTFLHVFEASASSSSSATVEMIANGDFEGVDVLVGKVRWVALFAKTSENISKTFTYSVSNPGSQHHLISDLAVGTSYDVLVKTSDATVFYKGSHTVDSNGLIEFEFTSDTAVDVTMTAKNG